MILTKLQLKFFFTSIYIRHILKDNCVVTLDSPYTKNLKPKEKKRNRALEGCVYHIGPEKGVESRTKCTVGSQKLLHIVITTNLLKLLETNL